MARYRFAHRTFSRENLLPLLDAKRRLGGVFDAGRSLRGKMFNCSGKPHPVQRGIDQTVAFFR